MKMKKSAKGFTLVELMIVVAIIAVLAAIALPAFGQQIRRSRDGSAVALMSTFRASVSMVVANLEGQAPLPAHFVNILNGGNVQSNGGGVTTTAPQVDRWNRIATCTVNNGNFNAGTPERVNWEYGINGGEAQVRFTDVNTNDTSERRLWTTY